MKIAVSGTSNIGKSTLIEDFCKVWPMYKVANESYRSVKEKNDIKLNQEGDKESQILIRDALIDEVQKYPKDEKVIFDRCVLDNLVYTMWLNAKETPGIDDLFVEQQMTIVKETLKLYDIIFFLPLSQNFPVKVEEKTGRDVDPKFREEIDYLFKAIMRSYYGGKRNIFPATETAAVIEVFGSREERIKLLELYIDAEGTCYGEEDSLLSGTTENPFDQFKFIE